jgi:hypothetical protein
VLPTPEGHLAVYRAALGQAFWWLATGAFLGRFRAASARALWAVRAEVEERGLASLPLEEVERAWELPGLAVAADGTVVLPGELIDPLCEALRRERPDLLGAVAGWLRRRLEADVASLAGEPSGEAGRPAAAPAASLAEVAARTTWARLLAAMPAERARGRRALRQLVRGGLGSWLADHASAAEEKAWGIRLEPARPPGALARSLAAAGLVGLAAAAPFLASEPLRRAFDPPAPDFQFLTASGRAEIRPGEALRLCDRHQLGEALWVQVGDREAQRILGRRDGEHVTFEVRVPRELWGDLPGLGDLDSSLQNPEGAAGSSQEPRPDWPRPRLGSESPEVGAGFGIHGERPPGDVVPLDSAVALLASMRLFELRLPSLLSRRVNLELGYERQKLGSFPLALLLAPVIRLQTLFGLALGPGPSAGAKRLSLAVEIAEVTLADRVAMDWGLYQWRRVEGSAASPREAAARGEAGNDRRSSQWRLTRIAPLSKWRPGEIVQFAAGPRTYQRVWEGVLAEDQLENVMALGLSDSGALYADFDVFAPLAVSDISLADARVPEGQPSAAEVQAPVASDASPQVARAETALAAAEALAPPCSGTGQLPDGRVGQPYSASLLAGPAPVIDPYSGVRFPSLPPGLEIAGTTANSDGAYSITLIRAEYPDRGFPTGVTLTGTATHAGSYRIEVHASRTSGETPPACIYQLTIHPETGLAAGTASQPEAPADMVIDGTVGTALEAALHSRFAPGHQQQGGWKLPPGLRYDAAREAFVGVPTRAGEWRIAAGGVSSGETRASTDAGAIAITFSIQPSGCADRDHARCGAECVDLEANPFHWGECFAVHPDFTEAAAEAVRQPPAWKSFDLNDEVMGSPRLAEIDPAYAAKLARHGYYRLYYRWSENREAVEVRSLLDASGWSQVPPGLQKIVVDLPASRIAGSGYELVVSELELHCEGPVRKADYQSSLRAGFERYSSSDTWSEIRRKLFESKPVEGTEEGLLSTMGPVLKAWEQACRERR